VLVSPLAHPLDIGRAAEHVSVLRLAQPLTLAVGLAGPTALGFAAELLVPPIVAVGHEQLFAVQALTTITFRHA
jgi:hypothetical protein